MSDSLSSIFDRQYYYRLLSLVWYLFFLNNAILSFERGRIPIIPNLILLLVSILSIFYSTTVASEMESVRHGRRWLIFRMLLGIIPTMLGMFIVFRWIREQRKNNASLLDYLGPLVLALVLSYLSILIMLWGFVFFSLDVIPSHQIYLMSILVFWSMIGFTAGDLIRLDAKQRESKYKFFFNLFLDRKQRIRTTYALSILLILLLIFTSPADLHPVAVDYDSGGALYIGNNDIIQSIELDSDLLGFDLSYNGSTAPLIISSIVLEKTKQFANEQFVPFRYFASLVGVNSSLDDLMLENSTVVYNGVILGDLDDISTLSLNSSHQLLYQYLEDPFGWKTHVSVVVVLEGDTPILWISTNSDWSSLRPTFR